MDKIKILVACHKPYEVRHDDVYTPIHVGRAISRYKDEMRDMIGDDTGDNISEKNPYYSELTALYWAWKNLHDVEYVGLEHYRRQFNFTFTADNIDSLFSDGTDVILAGPVYRHWRYETLKSYVCSEDIAIMLCAVKKHFPEYVRTIEKYADGYIDYPLNMFVCKKELFDQYAEWLFTILFECEKHIKLSPYSRARRVYGYLAEFLMPTYFLHHQCNIKPMKYTHLDEGVVYGGISKNKLIRRKIYDKILGKSPNPRLYVDYSIRAGLEADGILKKDLNEFVDNK